MSNSGLFQVKEDEKKIKSSDDIQLPTSTNPDICTYNVAPGEDRTVDRKQDENNPNDDDDAAIMNKKLFEEDCSEDPDKGRSCLGQYDKIETIQRRSTQPQREHDDTHKSINNTNDDGDDSDGFTTPTSSDHKIPLMTTCPPAPKKSTKRKLSASPSIHPTLHVDFESTVDEEKDLGINKVRKLDHQE
ncbi:uncharacterized protein LOC132050943 [Lycium ferocissimum]|uniref:uncharacterized protein LOC132050943 n=1 Tax=Lycium ferocissimum TaxID=112874 RepID=UPI0028161D2C|nr:uncharacterized protein LOC132050943 [Lycium ferocissimum]